MTYLRAMTVALSLLGTHAAWADGCAVDRVDLRSGDKVHSFDVEVADDANERAVGLMNRESMPTDAGMLFVYERPQRVSFWMANTLIPLDMIFLDRAGVVTRVHANAKPLDRTAIAGGDAVFAVLEINGGLARRLGIRAGSQLRHPALGPNAKWSCPQRSQ